MTSDEQLAKIIAGQVKVPGVIDVHHVEKDAVVLRVFDARRFVRLDISTGAWLGKDGRPYDT